MNFGHRNPEITATAHAQLDLVTLVSRAFHAEPLGRFCAALAALCDKDMVLPMNSGAEAVESAIKVARKWGTDVKGVLGGHANIVVESADAYVFGLNAVSHGRHVVYPAAAVGFAGQLRRAGFEPIGVEMSELLKGGGSVKCCTLEVYS